MTISIIDTQGFNIAGTAMRLSYGSNRKTMDTKTDGNHEMFKDDYYLLKRLIQKGNSHAKVMRMVHIYLDINAPRYWWAEFDTYKVGTVTMSESTMHTIKNGLLDVSHFENGIQLPDAYLNAINSAIDNKLSIHEIKQLLPESFLQRRIVDVNYQTLRSMYFDREHHKLPEWKQFCAFIKKEVPFSELIWTVKSKEEIHG